MGLDFLALESRDVLYSVGWRARFSGSLHRLKRQVTRNAHGS
jgi:hypothetical protein